MLSFGFPDQDVGNQAERSFGVSMTGLKLAGDLLRICSVSLQDVENLAEMHLELDDLGFAGALIEMEQVRRSRDLADPVVQQRVIDSHLGFGSGVETEPKAEHYGDVASSSSDPGVVLGESVEREQIWQDHKVVLVREDYVEHYKRWSSKWVPGLACGYPVHVDRWNFATGEH